MNTTHFALTIACIFSFLISFIQPLPYILIPVWTGFAFSTYTSAFVVCKRFIRAERQAGRGQIRVARPQTCAALRRRTCRYPKTKG